MTVYFGATCKQTEKQLAQQVLNTCTICEKYPEVQLRIPTVFRAERAKEVGDATKKLALRMPLMAVVTSCGIII